jgi:outer membrane immunogenic protein
MKRLLLGTLGLAAVAVSSALAADVPQPQTYVPFFTWNGFYLGINAGYGFGRSDWTDTVTQVSTGGFNVNGTLVGGTAGYNLQFGGWVVGVEADAAWTNIKGATTTNCVSTCETSSDWLATARGRLGYAFDRFLPYVTAGAAFGGLKGSVAGFGSFSETAVGWTAGGGVEYAFIDHWSAKVEYVYVDLGKSNCGTTCSGGNPFDATFTTNVVRGGINYRF